MRRLTLIGLMSALAVSAHAAEVDRGGVALDGDGRAWLVTLEGAPHLPAALHAAGRRLRGVIVQRSGVLTLDVPLVGAPRPLGDAALPSLVAALWAPLEAGACPDGVTRGEVRRADTADGVRFAWIDLPLRGCPASAAAVTFSAELRFAEDGALRAVELRYEALPAEAQAIEPRAGLRLERPEGEVAVFELFPDPEGGAMRERGKWLLEGSSDGEAGAWTIDLGPDGDVLGDLDLDGWRGSDNCERDFNPLQEDLDGDEIGDACEGDTDNDFIDDIFDNCDRVPNRDQRDVDRDGLGDVCDPDDDGDGWPDGLDRCPDIFDPANLDLDGDGLGDACDPDPDGDDRAALRWGRRAERCPWAPDPLGRDADKDGLGDACDLLPWRTCRGDCRWQSDADGDGIGDRADVCPRTPDPRQGDLDGDGLGDACDPDGNGDGVFDLYQLCAEGACPLLDRPATFGLPRLEPR